MENTEYNSGRVAANIITKSLLNALGISSTNLNTNNPLTSSNLKELQDVINKVISKRTSLQENISSLEKSLANLENDFFKKQSGIYNRLFTKKETIENIGKEIDESRPLLNDLKSQFEECSLNIDYLSDPTYEEKYAKVVSTFSAVCNSNKIWDIVSSRYNTEIKSSASTTIDRNEVNFSTKRLDFINCKYAGMHLPNANGYDIYIYPTFLLLKRASEGFEIVDLKELKFSFRQQRFLEPEITKPSDANIIDHTWAKVNKDGTRDMRFAGNYQIPVVQYASFTFSSSQGLNELYYVSNYNIAEQFAEVFGDYLASIRGQGNVQNGNTHISKEYFTTLKDFSEKLSLFVQKLKDDKSFCKFLDNVKGIENLTNEGAEKAIELLLLIDVLKCFNQISDLYNFKSKEAFAAIYLQGKLHGLNMEYGNRELLYGENLINSYKTVYDSLKGELTDASLDDENFFKLSYILNAYDKDLNEEYLSNLYQFASIVIKADGVVSAKEEEVLKRIKKAPEEKSKKVEQSVKVKSPVEEQSLEEVLEELNSLTGLDAVKQEIKSLINFIRIQKAREASGLKSSTLSYHIVFTGNPGTGKTTVARIVSKIYKSLGVLSEGQLVETDRSGLVAEYVGQTAVKVNKTVNSALNGVLFIDEAYSIVGENQDDFGKEAVATLIKRMEDDRDKLIIVLAGYTNEMKDFIDTNPGFKSRFNRYIEFTDYSPNELVSIFQSLCTKLDYKLTEDAQIKVSAVFEKAFATRDKSFGNGRYVRNIFEKTLEKQANRLASVTSLDKEMLTTIIADDIP